MAGMENFCKRITAQNSIVETTILLREIGYDFDTCRGQRKTLDRAFTICGYIFINHPHRIEYQCFTYIILYSNSLSAIGETSNDLSGEFG